MIALSQCPGIDPVKDSSAALQAALNLGQPITADCPVNCVMGSDPTKSIFVPSGSDVTFIPGKGRLDVDNVGFPALAFLNSTAIWRGTRIRYVGTPSLLAPHASNVWNDGPAKAYLAKLATGSTMCWTGPTNTSAVISVRGNSNVQMLGGRIYVDDDATADRYPSTAFDLGPCMTATGSALPIFVTSDFELDGSVMGYVGTARALTLTRITRRRYADLQDATGGTVGGIGCWLAPPHWMYFNDTTAAPMGVIKIKDAVDLADYRGAPLRRPTTSGYINVMKMTLVNGSSIDGFHSRSLDGGIGLLSNGTSNLGGTIRNCYVRTDSSVLSVDGKRASTPGLFFPSSSAYPSSDIEISVDDASVGSYPITNVPAGTSVRSTVRVGVGA